MASTVVQVQADAPVEKAGSVLTAFTAALEAKGHALRLADLEAMQTGRGRVGVEVNTDDPVEASAEVQGLIEDVDGGSDVLFLTGTTERLD